MKVTNLVASCVRARAVLGKAPKGYQRLALTFELLQITANCGCKSAAVKYRLFTESAPGPKQVLVREFNTLRMRGKTHTAEHKVKLAQAPFQVQVACGGAH